MIIAAKKLSNQPIIFTFGLIFFFIAAYCGWEKLNYGFNFLDEGWHMTEGWRLAEGDHFVKDRLVGGIRLYSLINGLVFKISPDIRLVSFRKLQHILAICSLFLFSVALYKVDGQFWYQPFIFSLFAFTGLDINGWSCNLNYYTYPHLFNALYLSFLILGLCQKNPKVKRLMYIVSGLFLWLISINLLYLSVIVLSPILLFIVSHKLRLKTFSLNFQGLCYILASFLFCWIIFISIYNKPYIICVFKSISLFLSIPHYTPDDLVVINWEVIKHLSINLVLLSILIIGLIKFNLSIFIGILLFLSLLIFVIIETSFFGLINPYYNGWFRYPIWFHCLLISFFIVFLFHIVRKFFSNQKYNRVEELCIVLLIPCAILSLSTSFFSGVGVVTLIHSSIPATAALAGTILYQSKIQIKSYPIKLLILIIFFFPFYYAVAWSDWKSTCWDVLPEDTSVTIEKGFGKGIKTNPIYYNLYEWIRMNTEKYAEKDDFMISYRAPMVHMISKLRPSIDFAYMPLTTPDEYYERSIQLMKKIGRRPKLAFVFERIPAFYPASLKENKYVWLNKAFSFPLKHPVPRYRKSTVNT